MSPRRRAQLHVIETEQDRAVTRLHHLIRHRDALRAAFRDYWVAISAGAADADLDRWAEGSLELAFVNAGPECQLAFWRMSVDLKSELTLNGLADFAHAAADICRGAGAQAALACLQALPAARRRLPTVGDIALWSRGLVRMAREAPESVVAVASRTDMILQDCDSSGFESFIATGLKYTRGDRARQRAFFTLEDRLAAQVLEQAAGALTFSRNERILKAYATALWGRPPVLRSAVAPPGGQLAAPGEYRRRRGAYSAGVPRRAEKRLAAIVSRLRRACDRPCGADADALSDRIAQAAANGAYRIGGGCAGRDLGDAILPRPAPRVGAVSRRRRRRA